VSKGDPDFLKWVTDSARTGDELFTVELLIERMRVWPTRPFRERTVGDLEEKMRLQKERKFTPAAAR